MQSSYLLNFFETDNKHPLSEEGSLSLLLKANVDEKRKSRGRFSQRGEGSLLQASELQQYLDVN